MGILQRLDSQVFFLHDQEEGSHFAMSGKLAPQDCHC